MSELLNNFFLYKKYNNFTRINFSGSGHFEYLLKPIFYFFNQDSWSEQKLILLMYIRFLNLWITLMTLIVPTFLSLSGYYFKGNKSWECNFSLKWLSQNVMAILPLNRETNSTKFSDLEGFWLKAHGYYENSKQNIWNEFITWYYHGGHSISVK